MPRLRLYSTSAQAYVDAWNRATTHPITSSPTSGSSMVIRLPYECRERPYHYATSYLCNHVATAISSLDNDFSVGGLLGWMPPLTNRQAFSTIHNLRLRPLCSLIRQRILPNLTEYRRYAPTLDGSAFRTGVVRYLKAHIPRYDTSLRLLLRPSGALCYRSKLTCRKKRLL